MTATDDEKTDRRSRRPVAERILLVAPTADDAELASRILEQTGSAVVAFDCLTELASAAAEGAGVVVIASEALADEQGCRSLRELLDRQEPWSEIPILIIGGGGDDEAARLSELLGPRAHIVLLDRPLGVAAFVTAAEAALRSRRRQYEVRRLLHELGESAAAIKAAHEEANRAKDDFLATLAHELRSPMTAIRGWIQMLRAGDLDAEEAADALSMIESSSKVQAHIIEDLMDMSRIVSGKVMIERALIDLAPVVTNVVTTFRPAADVQGVHLSAELPPEPVTVWADAVRLQQVGWNLVSNAIKFTPPGGSIRVILARENDSAVLRIRDTGAGISRELLPHVFEPYRQAEGESSKQHRGVGLGLTIVRHLVERHGGTIEAFSEGPGKGSEFVVTLPVRESERGAQ